MFRRLSFVLALAIPTSVDAALLSFTFDAKLTHYSFDSVDESRDPTTGEIEYSSLPPFSVGQPIPAGYTVLGAGSVGEVLPGRFSLFDDGVDTTRVTCLIGSYSCLDLPDLPADFTHEEMFWNVAGSSASFSYSDTWIDNAIWFNISPSSGSLRYGHTYWPDEEWVRVGDREYYVYDGMSATFTFDNIRSDLPPGCGPSGGVPPKCDGIGVVPLPASFMLLPAAFAFLAPIVARRRKRG